MSVHLFVAAAAAVEMCAVSRGYFVHSIQRQKIFGLNSLRPSNISLKSHSIITDVCVYAMSPYFFIQIYHPLETLEYTHTHTHPHELTVGGEEKKG